MLQLINMVGINKIIDEELKLNDGNFDLMNCTSMDIKINKLIVTEKASGFRIVTNISTDKHGISFVVINFWPNLN